jgi:hypothetical protein
LPDVILFIGANDALQSSPVWSYTAGGWKLGSVDNTCVFLEDSMGRIQNYAILKKTEQEIMRKMKIES